MFTWFSLWSRGVVENAVKINTKAGKDLYFYDTKSCYEHIKNNEDDLKSYAAYVLEMLQEHYLTKYHVKKILMLIIIKLN